MKRERAACMCFSEGEITSVHFNSFWWKHFLECCQVKSKMSLFFYIGIHTAFVVCKQNHDIIKSMRKIRKRIHRSKQYR